MNNIIWREINLYGPTERHKENKNYCVTKLNGLKEMSIDGSQNEETSEMKQSYKFNFFLTLKI